MQGGGHIRGYLLPESLHEGVLDAIAALRGSDGQMLFAVGDGNHSLASAKACHDEAPTELNRYALVELVNIHSDALDFEPIYRTVENVDPEGFCRDFERYLTENGATLTADGDAEAQHYELLYGESSVRLNVKNAPHTLAVGCAQEFIDSLIADGSPLKVDYIHGEDEVKELAHRPGCVGILYDGLTKHSLFSAVENDGVLPRKTFSMGHARDKRYYTEVRLIK